VRIRTITEGTDSEWSSSRFELELERYLLTHLILCGHGWNVVLILLEFLMCSVQKAFAAITSRRKKLKKVKKGDQKSTSSHRKIIVKKAKEMREQIMEEIRSAVEEDTMIIDVEDGLVALEVKLPVV